MDQVIPEYYKTYGKYINSNRAFPLDLDGLKPVERRVLLSAYEIARNKFVKSAKLDGYCIGNLHPHGQVYGSIVQLVNQGFLIGQGNFGSKLGIDPAPAAASRYTECKLADSTREMALDLIEHVPWIQGELEKEPQFLPTMFPFCLMGREYTQGIGFAYRSFIPCFKVEDLHKRLLWLLKMEEKEPVIVPICDCKILSSKKILKELLTKGKATLSVQGVYQVDRTRQKVTIKSWPPGRRFESLLSKFSKELENQDVGFLDLSSEKDGTSIVFEVLKQRNRESILASFIKKVDEALQGSLTFEIITVDKDSNIIRKSVDELLATSFKVYSATTKKMLEKEVDSIRGQIEEYELLTRLKPYIKEYLNEDIDSAIVKISQSSGVEEKLVSELLAKYKIKKLFSLDTDTTQLKQKKEGVEKCLTNLISFVLTQYKNQAPKCSI